MMEVNLLKENMISQIERKIKHINFIKEEIEE